MPKDYQYVPLPPEFRTTRPVGPVRDQRSDAERLEALLATRDRLAQQTPTERLIAGIDPTPGPRRSAAPTVTLASLTGRESPPDELSFGLNPKRWIEEKVFTPAVSGVGSLIGALDRPPTGYPVDTPYTSPLRIASSAFATMPAAAGTVYDALAGQRTDAPVVDPMRPSEEQATFSGEVARRGGGPIAQALGTLADVVVDPGHGLQLLGAAAPVFMGAGKLAKVAQEAQAARALTGGFYSRVDEAAKFLPAKGVKAESLINTLKKASGGVSAEELELRGLAEFAASKRGQVVTPADLSAHLKANPAPFPTVKTLGRLESVKPLPEGYRVERLAPRTGMAYGAMQHNYTLVGPDGSVRTFYALGAADAQSMAMGMLGLNVKAPIVKRTKFSKYQVPGGENYRETLLTLPAKQRTDARYAILSDARNPNSGVASRATTMSEAIAEAGGDATRVREIVGGTDPVNFRSSHFDDPNILAHTRSNERTSPTGERGTFLEEVQSDWHQAGKERGYINPESVNRELANLKQQAAQIKAAFDAKHAEWESLREQLRQASQRVGSSATGYPSVSSAFKDSPARYREGMRQTRAWHAALEADAEVQSLRQLGKNLDRELSEIASKLSGVNLKIDNLRNPSKYGSVPDAPFKENWPDLSLKQALIDEANRSPDPGFLGATGGKTQINRWGTERLAWEPIGKTGQGPAFRVSFEPQVGGNAAGGDMGEEALRRGLIQNSSTTVHSLEELTQLLDGSEVKAEKAWKRMMAKPEGGLYQPRAEGMAEFYDKQLPAKLEKILKPFGGSVERGEILGAKGVNEYGMPNKYPQPEPAWLSRLTPEMKARILKEGLPLMGLSGVTLGSLLGAEKQQAR